MSFHHIYLPKCPYVLQNFLHALHLPSFVICIISFSSSSVCLCLKLCVFLFRMSMYMLLVCLHLPVCLCIMMVLCWSILPSHLSPSIFASSSLQSFLYILYRLGSFVGMCLAACLSACTSGLSTYLPVHLPYLHSHTWPVHPCLSLCVSSMFFFPVVCLFDSIG